MSPEMAFKMQYGIGLHFSSMDYSMLKYGINTKSANSKFTSLSREQLYRIEWLCSKFKDTQNIVYASIGCQFDGINIQFDSKDAVLDSYYKFKRRRESMSYSLKSDRKKHIEFDLIPLEKLIFKYFIGEISPEYVILTTYETDLLLTLYNSPNFLWSKNKILKIIKYDAFFNSRKYLPILEIS